MWLLLEQLLEKIGLLFALTFGHTNSYQQHTKLYVKEKQT